MDSDVLVNEKIDDGQRLIDQLVRDGVDATVGLWIRASEDGSWQLYIATPSINPQQPGVAYRAAYAALDKLADCRVTPVDLTLISGANPVALAAVEARDRHPQGAPVRYRGKRLGNLSIQEAYIYPPPGKWFDGFDEIKRHFPSAEAMMIPTAVDDVPAATLAHCAGAVNAEACEGRWPGTVLFVGPMGSSGRPLTDLYFVHRPEGWNTLYRAETKRYEEVRHVGSGSPLYRPADFGPFAAVKGKRAVGADKVRNGGREPIDLTRVMT